MTRREGLEFRILGPLEVRVAGESIALGGAKQRAVLAALLLRAGEVVSVDRLIDEVWGEAPPPSAAHGLEAYVSRIRQLLNGHGPSLVRRGTGYCLELGDASLDARDFERLAEQCWSAAADGRLEESGRLATEALGLWQGPALADVVLASAGRSETERLEELRLRTSELRFDAELALGRHEALVGEIQALVGQSPYRERLVAQLMLALYRSGRQAEALEVYEQMRRRLMDDLGLQPSAELRDLSGQIVRQEPQLTRRRSAPAPSVDLTPARRRIGRGAMVVLVGAAVAATMALTASGGARHSAVPVSTRVALILPRAPEVAIDEPRVRETTTAVRESVVARGHEYEILVADDVDPTREEIEDVVRRVESGRFALVLVVGGGATSRALHPLVRRSSATRFVFLDASLATLSLTGVPNATGMPFADHETSQLMGYLSGLVRPRGARPGERADVVSIVASRATPRAERLVNAFRKGARRSRARPSVRVAYVTDETDKTACEQLANEQIDAGSDVVYAVAGKCSSSVLAVAKLRGIWGIRANDDPFGYGPHILATTYKRWDQAVREALAGFELDLLPRGRDRVLGLADDYAVDAWGNGGPEAGAVWSKVTRLCSSIREHTETAIP